MEAEIINSVKEMTVLELIQTPLFLSFLTEELKRLSDSRDAARMECNNTSGRRLKAHVIDRLRLTGIWVPYPFASLFLDVINKVATGYSSSERSFIKDVGMVAFSRTIEKMQQDEEARANSDGQNNE